MQFIILSGRSGSGKTTALQTLEDLGFYCVDNMPLGLLPTLATTLEQDTQLETVAVGIDVRNVASHLPHFREVLEKLRALNIKCDVVYLDADDTTLVRRFSATRRRHPLSNASTSLTEAIAEESSRLAGIADAANLNINTSGLSVHELRDRIRSHIANRQNKLSLLFESFAYKHGVPSDADLVFDVRHLPNPYWDDSLRPYTGLDGPVQTYLKKQPATDEVLDDISGLLANWLHRFKESDRNYLTVAIGCTGGQHRSVFIVEALTQHFQQQASSLELNVQSRHRELAHA